MSKAIEIPTTTRAHIEPDAAHSAHEAVERILIGLDRPLAWQPLAARATEVLLLRELSGRLAPVLMNLVRDVLDGDAL